MKIKLLLILLIVYSAARAQERFGSINKNLDAKLKDTSTFNPWVENDQVDYKPMLRSTTAGRSAQIKFLYSSGFPFSISPNGARPNQLPKTFRQADEQYKSYKQKEAKNEYIDVFRQNASALIIRKYLLNKPAENKALQFYTEELLKTHSKNYGLLYLSISQLKPFIGEQETAKYKLMIQTDPVTAEIRRNRDNVQKLSTAESVTAGDTNTLNAILAKSIAISKARDAYFLRKISHI